MEASDATPQGMLAVASSSVPEELGPAVLKNVFELWFTPEIERRRSAGLIDDSFVLFMAQAIFPEQGNNKIRLNDEVRGQMLVRAVRPVEKGEQALLSDMANLEAFELEDDEMDCGHFTVIRSNKGWQLTFNALAGRKKAANLVRLAKDFLKVAQYSVESAAIGPAIDNLFSSCELLAKADLIVHRMLDAKAKSHGVISSKINQWGKLGNVHPQFVAILNRLSNQRANARYAGPGLEASMPSREDVEIVSAYAAHLQKLAAPSIS